MGSTDRDLLFLRVLLLWVRFKYTPEVSDLRISILFP